MLSELLGKRNPRIAIRFSPPKSSPGGSQNTIAEGLIPELCKLHEDIILFTANAALFENLPHVKVCPTRDFNRFKNLRDVLKERFLDNITFERLLRKHRCDVVYYPYTHEALLFTLTIPQVVTVHDLIPVIYPNLFPLMSRQWKYYTLPCLRHVSRIVAVSKNTKHDLIRLAKVDSDRIHVVYNGFRSQKTDGYVRNEFGKYFLYVCSTQYPYKNLTKLLEAFAMIIKVWALPHKLLIVGQKVQRFADLVPMKIADLGLNGRVIVMENVPQHQLSLLYRFADLFVYPSLYEGFGIPVLEAMSCGVPVIASNAASIPEVCGDAAWYFNPVSKEDIARAMGDVLIDAVLREDLVSKGFKRTKLFSWKSAAEAIFDICESTMSEYAWRKRP